MRGKAVIGVRDTGVAYADFCATAESWVAEGAEVGHGVGVVVVAGQVNDGARAITWRVNDELTWYGDAVWRALGTHDSPTFPAMMFSKQEGELSVTHGTLCDGGIRLPWRQDKVALAPGGGGRGWQWPLSHGRACWCRRRV